MGNPIEPNGYDLGVPCPGCWGMKTPERFLAIIQDVKKCHPLEININGFWVLEQTHACIWKGTANGIDLVYNAFFAVANSSYFNANFGHLWFFSSVRAPVCTLTFESGITELDCGLDFKSYGGTVNLLYGPGI